MGGETVSLLEAAIRAADARDGKQAKQPGHGAQAAKEAKKEGKEWKEKDAQEKPLKGAKGGRDWKEKQAKEKPWKEGQEAKEKELKDWKEGANPDEPPPSKSRQRARRGRKAGAREGGGAEAKGEKLGSETATGAASPPAAPPVEQGSPREERPASAGEEGEDSVSPGEGGGCSPGELRDGLLEKGSEHLAEEIRDDSLGREREGSPEKAPQDGFGEERRLSPPGAGGDVVEERRLSLEEERDDAPHTDRGDLQQREVGEGGVAGEGAEVGEAGEEGDCWSEEEEYVPTAAEVAALAEMEALGKALLATSRNVSVAPSEAGDDAWWGEEGEGEGEEEDPRSASLLRQYNDEGLAPSSDENCSSSSSTTSSLPPSAPLTASQLAAHERSTDVIERRQFNCATHGSFWKWVKARKPIATCRGCAGGAEGRLEAVPREEERGRGYFRCELCGNGWTSNSACRKLGQYCQAEGCEAIETGRATLPSQIRAHLSKEKLAERRMHFKAKRGAPLSSIDENSAEHTTQPEPCVAEPQQTGGAEQPEEPLDLATEEVAAEEHSLEQASCAIDFSRSEQPEAFIAATPTAFLPYAGLHSHMAIAPAGYMAQSSSFPTPAQAYPPILPPATRHQSAPAGTPASAAIGKPSTVYATARTHATGGVEAIGRAANGISTRSGRERAVTDGGKGGKSAWKPMLRKHFCAGCATGACRDPLPISKVHIPTGSTATASISAKTWSTDGSIAFSEGSYHESLF